MESADDNLKPSAYRESMIGEPVKTPSSCPDVSTLLALIEGDVDSFVATSLQDHLLLCESCQTRIENAGTDVTSPATPPTATSIMDRPNEPTVVLPEDADDTPTLVGDDFTAEKAALTCLLSSSDSPDVFGQLGPYEVCDVLGQGGMGVVFKGTDPSLRRPVAIKVLAPLLASNTAARLRFVREGRAQAAVNHPNLVTIYEVSELSEEDLPFLVMEYVDGESLQELVQQKGHLSVEEVARYGAQIAAGLAAAHEAGVIHRDIKPANILIDRKTDMARITDFGLALVLDEVDGRITQPGMLAGTPTYMSPEQIDQSTSITVPICSVWDPCCTWHSQASHRFTPGTSMRSSRKLWMQPQHRSLRLNQRFLIGWRLSSIGCIRSDEKIASSRRTKFKRPCLVKQTKWARLPASSKPDREDGEQCNGWRASPSRSAWLQF